MLSISKAGGGYYANLAVDDYYTKGGEPPGHWYGDGALAQNLTGQINREQFLVLCEGVSLNGEKLVQNAGKENHIAAHDLTFSAPKSVSTLWACGGNRVRREIQEAIWKAAKAGCDYIQSEAAYARRGDKSRAQDLDDIERAALTFALFEHGTSRAQDPQLHIHALALNFGIREDGTTATLESRVMHLYKMAAGAIFRAEFASELRRRLGVEIVRGKKGTFEIKGVSKELIEEFSKRRAEIEEAMKRDGVEGAKAAEHYALTTRARKEHVAREILFQRWEETGKEYGFDLREVISQIRREEIKREEKGNPRLLVHEAVQKITESKAYFRTQDLVRTTAELAVLKGVNAAEVRAAISDVLQSGALIHLRTDETTKIYTTPEIDQMEKRMLATVEEGRKKIFPSLTGEGGYLRGGLSEEQRRSVHHITVCEGSIKVVSGMAGAGKTTMLTAAREIWEAQGYEVSGVSLAAVAAKNLETESGIKSVTIAKLLHKIEQGKNPLSSKTVLVADEAGMVGTRQMVRLIEETEKRGTKLVLVGDERQLQAIEHGAPFRIIGDIVGKSELKEIRRQQNEKDREAVYAFAEGRAHDGLRPYIERNLLTIQETKEEAIKTLVFDWQNDETPLQNKAIFGTTREAIRGLNVEAQATRKERGELGDKSLEANGYHFFEGDRIQFTKNSRKLGVLNGDLGTVVKINEHTDHLYIKLDREALVSIPLFSYRSVELGYARTTHKMQGKTVGNAYVLSGGSMVDRELSYVQVSRHRNEARLYFSVEESGTEIQKIAAVMSRSRQKEIAQEQRRENTIQPGQSQHQERGIDISR
jgi:Ti-type conjugative transfer relaxase TraA